MMDESEIHDKDNFSNEGLLVDHRHDVLQEHKSKWLNELILIYKRKRFTSGANV